MKIFIAVYLLMTSVALADTWRESDSTMRLATPDEMKYLEQATRCERQWSWAAAVYQYAGASKNYRFALLPDGRVFTLWGAHNEDTDNYLCSPRFPMPPLEPPHPDELNR